MRSPSADYLEASKLEELAADLERRGYRVAREARLGDQQVDLLAERGGERLAFEVKARSRLNQSIQEVARLREAALDAGLTEFRLVVVTPPHAVEVTIENLSSELLGYFVEHEMPEELAALSSELRVDELTDVEIESVDLRRSRVHVRGRGYVEVELDDGQGNERDGLTTSDSFPFSFDLELDQNLEIVKMNQLSVDTKAFYEYRDAAYE